MGMDESEIVERIHHLVARCHELENQHRGVGLTAEQRQRLADLQAQVDKHWEELRRQRAAKRLAETPSLVPPGAVHAGTAAKAGAHAISTRRQRRAGASRGAAGR